LETRNTILYRAKTPLQDVDTKAIRPIAEAKLSTTRSSTFVHETKTKRIETAAVTARSNLVEAKKNSRDPHMIMSREGVGLRIAPLSRR